MLVGARAGSSVRPPVEPETAQWIGPEAGDPTGRRPPRGVHTPSSVGLGHGVAHPVDADGTGQRPSELSGRPIAHGPRRPLAEHPVEIVGDPVDVGVDAVDERPLRAHPGRELPAQRVDALSGARRDAHHPHPVVPAGHLGDETGASNGQPVRGEDARQVVERRRPMLRRDGVDLVEHHQGHAGVAGEAAQVAVVERGVGVLLGIHDPHEHVDDPHEAVDLLAVGGVRRVVVGEVEEDEAVQRRVVDHDVLVHLQPRQEAGHVGAQRRVGREHGRQRARRGRAAHAGRGQLASRQGVERR